MRLRSSVGCRGPKLLLQIQRSSFYGFLKEELLVHQNQTKLTCSGQES